MTISARVDSHEEMAEMRASQAQFRQKLAFRFTPCRLRFDWREWQGQLAVEAMNKPGIERSAVKGD